MTCSICPHLFQGTGLLQGCSRLSGMQKGRKDRAAICGFSDTGVCTSVSFFSVSLNVKRNLSIYSLLRGKCGPRSVRNAKKTRGECFHDIM